jgi:glycosyltransferase involved in cell wall biosynthesis
MSEEVKLSICTVTYNQKDYIAQTLDSFLMQKTNFKFQVIVGDDCSTDGTREIIKEYAEKYPDIIKPILRGKNIGAYNNSMDVYSRVMTEYIAICDGDDYWCDEYKLQKQVDFMDAHPEYTLCYHPAKMVYENENRRPTIIGKSKRENPQPYYELLKGNNIPAGSVVYRFKCLKDDFLNRPDDIYPGDWYNHIVVGNQGKIGYLPDVMYVYRWHSQGISHTASDYPEKEIHLKYGIREVNFSYAVWNKVKDRYPQYYNEIFVPMLRDVYIAYLSESKLDEINILHQKYSQYFKDIKFPNINLNKFEKIIKKYKKYKKLYNIFLIISTIFAIIISILLFLL